VSREQATASLAAQATRAARLAMADDVIENTGRAEDLAARVAELHGRYLEFAAAGCAPPQP